MCVIVSLCVCLCVHVYVCACVLVYVETIAAKFCMWRSEDDKQGSALPFQACVFKVSESDGQE